MNATTAGRLFGYGRVSTTDQRTDNQRRELEQSGFPVHARRWFTDTISGKVPAMQRPEFAKLLDRIEEGDSLVVAKLDRLGRDSIDVEQTLRHLEERGVSVIVLQMGALGKTDLTSSTGKLVRKILGAVADMERDLLIERTQAGLARAKAEGKALGRRWKTTVEQRADMRQRHAAGESVSSLARAFKISRGSVLNAVRL